MRRSLLMSEFNNARAQGGAGRVRVDRLPYLVDIALATLKETHQLAPAGAQPPAVPTHMKAGWLRRR